MSIPRLPPELLDHIIDLLYDSQTALGNCCLVSKSWIPSTRSHIFANVKIVDEERLRSWKEIFPDPSTSPARYAKTLTIDIQVAATADAEAGGRRSLLPFHGFSPVLKTLYMDIYFVPSSQIFDFIFSFPLLEDLGVAMGDNSTDDDSPQPPTVVQPRNQPMTGSLDLSHCGWMGFVISRLLSLPGGIHFWKLALECSRPEDISLTTTLVEECSHTLEYIKIGCSSVAGWGPDSIDLSKATRLTDSVFRVGSNQVDWITTVLIKPEHRDFQQITIYLPRNPTLFSYSDGANVRQIVGEEIFGQWLELDHMLAQLWESRSIRPKVLYYAPMGTGERITEHLGCLLPEMMGRGIIDLAERRTIRPQGM